MVNTKLCKCKFCSLIGEHYILNTYQTTYAAPDYTILLARKEKHTEDTNRFRIDTANVTYTTFIYACQFCGKTAAHNEMSKPEITFIDTLLEDYFICPICSKRVFKDKENWMLDRYNEKSYKICIDCQTNKPDECKDYIKQQRVLNNDRL